MKEENEEMQEMLVRRGRALFMAGQMMALELTEGQTSLELEKLARGLDIEALEKFLEDPPSDFLYADQCRHSIELAKRLRNGKEITWSK